MSDDVDKSLLSRLQALRGASVTPEKPASNPYVTIHPPRPHLSKHPTNPRSSIKFDVIERAKTPTRGDALAARLKNLRSQTDGPSSPASSKSTPVREKSTAPETNAPQIAYSEKTHLSNAQDPNEDVDALFETDDKALEEMLADVDTPEPEPQEEDVKALLEQLSASIPKDAELTEKNDDSDDSDGEKMNREVDDVLARFKDEAELDATSEPEQDENANQNEELSLPSVPNNPDIQDTPSKPHDMDDITARMAALRSASPTDLPSVPTSKPSKGINRLTSKTNYTDDDMDSWCTVCLEDATLRCLGCDGDVYCARCWREMHVGPAAAFDDRTHRAVQFTRDGKDGKEKKVALGA